ncbi:hypothetical protein JNK13_07315 [bacterium]|nr:hypothetical protein [bacterium]
MVSIKRLSDKYRTLCGRTYAHFSVHAEKYSAVLLFVFGIALLAHGLAAESIAQQNLGAPGVRNEDNRLYEVGDRLFFLLEGNLGALIMITAGLGAIVSAALGAYRAALGLLVVAVGAFILRSLVRMFFNFEVGDDPTQ